MSSIRETGTALPIPIISREFGETQANLKLTLRRLKDIINDARYEDTVFTPDNPY
jgi:hypothetical protein